MFRRLFIFLAVLGLAGIANAQYPVYSSYSVGPFGRVRGFSTVVHPAAIGPFGVTSYSYGSLGVAAYGHAPAAFGVRSFGYAPLSVYSFGAAPIDPCSAPIVTAPAAFGVRSFYYGGY